MKRTVLKVSAIAFMLQLSLTGFATERPDMEKGNFYFRHNAYQAALKEYEKAVSKAPKKNDAVLDARMGDCYRLMKDPQKAVIWYSKAVAAPRFVTNDMKLHYGESLMMLGCYEEATYWLKQYVAAAPANRRANNLLAGSMQATDMIKGKPKGIATLMDLNTDGADFAPSIFGNNLVFTSNSVFDGSGKKDKWTGSNYNSIYRVTCGAVGNCGNNFVQMGGKVSSKYHDGVSSFTKDQREMYFTRTMIEEDMFGQNSVAEQGVVHLELMVASDYDEKEQKYKKVTSFPYNNKKYSTIHPAISPDGNTLIFASDMPGGEGAVDLYISRKNKEGAWDAPINAGKALNTEGEEMFPVFLDNNKISFASNGHAGLGGLDVYLSTWDEQSQQWSSPVNAGIPINSSYDDMSLTMYEDGANGYFTSNRPATKMSDNIYHYNSRQLFLNAMVTDELSDGPVDQAKIILANGDESNELFSTADGHVSGELNPQLTYTVTISKPGFKEFTTTLPASRQNKANDTLQPVFKLIPEANIAYKATVLDEATGQPVENPLLVITQDGTNYADTINLATGAPFNKTLAPGNTYRINAINDAYYSDEKVVNTYNMTPGTIIRIGDTILMCKLSVGAVCQIGDIYYDFNKAEIRQDALASLEKVIKLLHDHKTLKLQINSHTDCRGTEQYNANLSRARAEVVIKYLEKKGVDMKRLKSKGFGEERAITNCPDCDACSEDQHQSNRRTEFLVLAL